MSEWLERASDDFSSQVWPALEDEARARLDSFASDVLRFGRSQNLVSRVDPAGEVARLIEESVRGGALLRSGAFASLMDVGSGAGFPGIVLASLYPSVAVTLVERRRSRAEFLERCVRRLDFSCVEVLAEDVRSLGGRRFDVATGKAVTDVSEFLDWVGPCLAPDAPVLLFQREGWNPPPGWVLAASTLSLRVERGDSRAAFLVRRRATPD